MAKISYSTRALHDLENISDFLTESGVDPMEALDLIDEAIAILARHPLIGRPVKAGMRELVISQGKTGDIVLYAYEAMHDTILVLAARHQREAGFRQ